MAFSISVTPTLAPNAFGSPSWAGWVNNAVSALETGATTAGTPGTPGYYQALPNGAVLSVSQNIVSGFSSWQGIAPGGGIFSSELGNRVQFGFVLDGQGAKVDIANLSFVGSSTDPGNSLGFSFAPGHYTYSSDYVGILFTDPSHTSFTTVTSGTGFVDMIVGRGSGNAWDVYSSDPGATDQDKINNRINGVWNAAGQTPFTFTGTYTYSVGAYGSATGSGNVVFGSATAVPVPGAALMGAPLLAGIAGVSKFLKRRR
jgi:hypothetical protein